MVRFLGAAAVCAAALCVAVAVSVEGADAALETGVSARSIALADAPGGAQVVVELSAPAQARHFFLDGDNPRFVVDLAGARWRPAGLPAGAGAGPGTGAVRGFRYAEHASGVSRLVLDLAGPGRVADVRETVTAQGATRLSFSLAIETEQAAPPPAAVTIPAPVEPRVGPRLIVIDAGHGGRDPGAIGVTGVREKDVVLDAALRLRAHLERTGRYRVAMTRDADAFIALEDRVQFARAQGADLFVSLHADAHADHGAQGASVYTLSEHGAGRARRLIDRSQDWRLDFADAAGDGVVRDILVDLTQRDTTNRSAAFAQTVIAHLAPVAPLLRNTHRNAGFFVLLAPDVPAVLIELGFLTNHADERRLASPAEREAMTQAIARSIDSFFAQPTRPAVAL